MARTTVASFGDDFSKWLPLAGILIDVGVIPRKYKGIVTTASLAVWLWRNFG